MGGLLAGVATAVIMGLPWPTSMGGISTAAWAALPDLGHLHFAFEPGLVPTFLAADLGSALISLLLPLTRQVSPSFFDHLPSYLHLVTESGPAMSLAAACTLTLLFRIASPQLETISWRASDKALADLARMLNANAAEWQLSPALIARTLSGVEQTLRLLKEGHYLRNPMSIVATHRENGLDIEVRDDGIALIIPTIHSTISAENEESPAGAGLQRLSIGVYPDRSATQTRAGHASISLGFNG